MNKLTTLLLQKVHQEHPLIISTLTCDQKRDLKVSVMGFSGQFVWEGCLTGHWLESSPPPGPVSDITINQSRLSGQAPLWICVIVLSVTVSLKSPTFLAYWKHNLKVTRFFNISLNSVCCLQIWYPENFFTDFTQYLVHQCLHPGLPDLEKSQKYTHDGDSF